MNMKREHFKAIAKLLKDNKPQQDGRYSKEEYSVAVQHWQGMVTDFAALCAISNEKFDRYRFRLACGDTERL